MSQPSCSVVGCGKSALSRGWCGGHYRRWYDTGDVQADKPLKASSAWRVARCSVADCEDAARAKGMCSTHYYRWKRTGDVQADKPLRFKPRDEPAAYEKSTLCTVEGCENFERARGWCMAHYSRWKRAGDVQADKPLARRSGSAARELQSSSPCSVDGCDRFRSSGEYCTTHARRTRVFGDARPDVPVTYGNQYLFVENSLSPLPKHMRARLRRESMQGAEISADSLREAHGDFCPFCGVLMQFVPQKGYVRERASVEHVVPVVRGGSHTADNCVLLCRWCNTAKNGRTLAEFVACVESGRYEGTYTDDDKLRIRRFAYSRMYLEAK